MEFTYTKMFISLQFCEASRKYLKYKVLSSLKRFDALWIKHSKSSLYCSVLIMSITLSVVIHEIPSKSFHPSKRIENITRDFRNCPKFPIFFIKKFRYAILSLSLWPYFQGSTDLDFLSLSFDFQCLKVLNFLFWNFWIECCYNLKMKIGNK